MAEVSLESTARPPAQAVVAKTSRLSYLDNLRAALVILVVLHHVALVYGASVEGYYYVEPPFTSPEAFRVLLAFAAVNQAWFMGALFLLAGYFTPGSFDRKGPASFFKARLLRLGIPLLFFTFVLSPISFIGWFLMPAALTGITTPLTWDLFWQMYPDLVGLGPLWFVALLLLFSIGYGGWRTLTGVRTPTATGPASRFSYLAIGVFMLALALASYLLRWVIPIGKSVWQFPTLAYLPQYLSFFILGIVAFRRDWLRTLPRSLGLAGLALAVVATVFLFPLAVTGRLFSLELSAALDNAMGNGHWQSAVYALWDTIVAMGLTFGLIVLFRDLVTGRGGLGRFLSRHSYTVYVIHIPIVVFVAYALRDIELGNLRKFALASLLIVPVCFAVAYVVRKLPLASRVL